MYTQQHLCFPKNLTPWQDSNPGCLCPEADAMSTAPLRQGTFSMDGERLAVDFRLIMAPPESQPQDPIHFRIFSVVVS
jgi:hypothetical protein